LSPSPADHETVFYDGGCGLCHRGIRFLARRARHDRLRFAPLGGATFEALVPREARADLPDSMIVRRPDGALLTRHAAAVEALRSLGGIWRAVGALLALVPRRLGDRAYDAVARRRRKWFSRPTTDCPVLSPGLRRLFLP
jgi:predicted DCC family thiol-disulfide oxidoreductase YuxK